MKTNLDKEILDSVSKSPNNWEGILYFNRKDPRVIVPKNLFLVIILSFLSLGLFGQAKSDTVFYTSEIELNTPTGDIFGTVTIPNNVEKSQLVLIIGGSGPTDRDCNSPFGLKTNAYKMLSVSLAENGISTLRFDKRGVGKSAPAVPSEINLRFETYVNDVVAWISLLKSDKRFSSITILGHSEGSLIGMIAAQQTNIAGFISISGAGQSIDKILQEQLKTNLTPQLFDESNKILDSLRIGKTVSNVNPNLLALYRPSVQPYLISCIKYDPAKEIGNLEIPVLIIQGTTDLQVTINDSKLLSAANPKAKLLIIENMNHVLKESDSNVQRNVETYANPDLPLKVGLTDAIVNFIRTKE